MQPHDSQPFRLLILVPAYNEAQAIVGTLASLRVLPWPHDVMVINDGSTDATGRLASRCGARVLNLPCNLGVGGAMQAGYLYAWENGYDIAVQFDADGQHLAEEVPALIEPLVRGQAELVVGSRLLGAGDYRFPLERRIGSRLLAGLVSTLLRQRFTDPTSGFRAAGRRVIRFFSRHYPQAWLGDTVEALVEAGRHGLTVTEVPARMQARVHGQSSANLLSGSTHTLRIVVAVLIDVMERKHDIDLTDIDLADIDPSDPDERAQP